MRVVLTDNEMVDLTDVCLEVEKVELMGFSVAVWLVVLSVF